MVSKIILQLGMFSKISFAKSSQNKSLSLRMEACYKKRYQNWVFLDLRLDYMQTHSPASIFETHTYPVGIS
jgi:hypothetical protein